MGTVSCTETGHGHCYDILTRVMIHFESFLGNDQGKGRIQTTADADHQMIAMYLF